MVFSEALLLWGTSEDILAGISKGAGFDLRPFCTFAAAINERICVVMLPFNVIKIGLLSSHYCHCEEPFVKRRRGNPFF